MVFIDKIDQVNLALQIKRTIARLIIWNYDSIMGANKFRKHYISRIYSANDPELKSGLQSYYKRLPLLCPTEYDFQHG